MRFGGASLRNRLESSMSSIKGWSGMPPTASRSRRETKMPWSPVQIPVRRERWFNRPRDHFEHRRRVGQADVKSTPEHGSRSIPQRVQKRRFHARVRVQEPDQPAPGKLRPALHLPSAMRLAACENDAAILAYSFGMVLAVAIDDDDLETVRRSDLPE